jgi:ArsR family transcriptional regulator
MFRALGDPERLRLLVRLAEGEACVSELAEHEGEKITTVSARLKTLYAVRLVKRRREAKHVFYALADEHVLPLVRNAIDHAAEGRTAASADPGQGKEDTP